MRSLFHFIQLAQKSGMPVNMLRFVHEKYSIEWTSGTSYTDIKGNTLYLRKTFRDHLANAHMGGQRDGKDFYHQSDRESVDEFYHEAAHAYIDLKLGTAPEGAHNWDITDGFRNRFLRLENATFSKKTLATYEQAVTYYDDKRVTKPDDWKESSFRPWVTDPQRVALEAASMYIGHRASWLWHTLDLLTYYKALLDENPKKADVVMKQVTTDTIPKYQKAMARRKFGYEERSHGAFFDVKHVPVDAPLPEQLRVMCDEVMESKIPDNFYRSERLNKLHLEIITKAMRINAGQVP